MSRKSIMNIIRDLAKYQGFYQRVLDNLSNMSAEDYNTYMCDLESREFDSVLDVIFYFERGII